MSRSAQLKESETRLKLVKTIFKIPLNSSIEYNKGICYNPTLGRRIGDRSLVPSNQVGAADAHPLA